MIRHDFPDLQWLKQQIAQGFVARRGPAAEVLKTPGWPSIILQVKSKDIYRDNIQGPFSLFGNLSGNSWVKLDNRWAKVGTSHFFVTNARQEYTLEIGSQPAETFNIHFGDSFAQEMISGYQLSVNQLLECNSKPTSTFHNHLLPKTEKTNHLIQQLQCNHDEMREEELLAELFTELYADQLTWHQKENDLPSIKKSTRFELLKRLLLCSDYIHSAYHEELNLEKLAQLSCLSKFHFLRLFKIAFGQTPHQFLNQVRITRAKSLLLENQTLAIHQVSKMVGFRDASSFSRTFYQQTGVYPTQYKS